MIEVVNVKFTKPDIYIGRYSPNYGNSFLHNHHKISDDMDRQQAIDAFARDFFEKPEPRFKKGIDQIMAHHAIHGHTKIGCWCKPEACHGDVIAEYLNQRINQCQK